MDTIREASRGMAYVECQLKWRRGEVEERIYVIIFYLPRVLTRDLLLCLGTKVKNKIL
jgi:hypothetical protein